MKRNNICVCEKCGHVNDIKKTKYNKNDDNNSQTQLIKLDEQVYRNASLPVCVQIKHCGFWITNQHGLH